MTELEKYELVNSCKTLEELSKAILKCADDNGYIQGFDRPHNAYTMSENCKILRNVQLTCLTRSYGIRQQGYFLMR